MKNTIIVILGLILIGGGIVVYLQSTSQKAPVATEQPLAGASAATTTAAQSKAEEVIGTSADGRNIMAYHFGTGSREILFVGGVHGGYEWNTVLVANDLIDYLKQHVGAVAASETVTVIPVLNPDGLAKVVDNAASFTAADVTASQETQVTGRYNGHGVDLNRNFDCDWKAKGVWQSTPVSGGSAPFSEPESQALRAYVSSHPLTAAVVWYSSAGGVFASNCHDGVLPETQNLVTAYSTASGYPPYDSFDFYAITGDAVNWLAKQKIPAISVLLTNHTDDEWAKNLPGVQAVLERYSQQ